jgi:mono/diheme cytochrome c family protein
MTTTARIVTLTAIVACFAAGHLAAQTLDYATYKAKVEPIFLKKREGHARCVVCHAGAGNWTEEQSRQNFEAVSKLVNASNLLSSPILKHPLAGTAGGDDFHSGGRQFTSRNDPDWKVMEEWARGAK